jgi:cation diffusion facilitator family transporter
VLACLYLLDKVFYLTNPGGKDTIEKWYTFYMSFANVNQANADREKWVVALSSVIAAIFLTSLKILVGLLTGSLGILSEAAHSGLDLVAAAVTFLAVRISGKPADKEHTYGHGKIENLSALFETFLLLLTCVWIIYEAIQRLFFKNVEIEASIWGFLIMGISIIIDLTRSRALYRVAKKHKSQALEADALHFSTDVWSSSVVIGGLGLVRLADILQLDWLKKADAISAIGVAGIVVYVSVELGLKTISDLLDTVPPGTHDEIKKAAMVQGVIEVKQVRVRRSGPIIFTDVTLTVSRDTGLEEAHFIAGHAKASVRKAIPGADVVVHVNPVVSENEDILSTIRLMATRRGLGAHAIRINQMADGLSLELHLEVEDDLDLIEAHNVVSLFEEDLRQELPEVKLITTHIEPDNDIDREHPATLEDYRKVKNTLEKVFSEDIRLSQYHDLRVESVGDRLQISFHLYNDPHVPITEAHTMAERIEQSIRLIIPDLGRVVIHMEPPEMNSEENGPANPIIENRKEN